MRGEVQRNFIECKALGERRSDGAPCLYVHAVKKCVEGFGKKKTNCITKRSEGTHFSTRKNSKRDPFLWVSRNLLYLGADNVTLSIVRFLGRTYVVSCLCAVKKNYRSPYSHSLGTCFTQAKRTVKKITLQDRI
jgi:hypothetical protein